MTDFRRPDLDLWEEEAEDDDARPTLVGPRPVAPGEAARSDRDASPQPAPSELTPTPAFGRMPSSAARDAQVRLREADNQARQREARAADPQRALLLQAKWAEARGLSAADTTLTDDEPPVHAHDDEDTRPIPPNFPAMLADSELAEYELQGASRFGQHDAIAKLRAGELPNSEFTPRPSLPSEELRSSEVDRLMVRPADEWGAFVNGLAEHVADAARPPSAPSTSHTQTPSWPLPQHTLRGLGTPGVAEGIAEGLRGAPTPLPMPAAIASTWPPVAQSLSPRVPREPMVAVRPQETERVFGGRKQPEAAFEAPPAASASPSYPAPPSRPAPPAASPSYPAPSAASPSYPAPPAASPSYPAPPAASPMQPRLPQLVAQSQPVPMPVPMPSIAPASDAPEWDDAPQAQKHGVTWWQLGAAAVVMVVVGNYVSAYGRQVSWSPDGSALAARKMDSAPVEKAAPSPPPPRDTAATAQAEPAERAVAMAAALQPAAEPARAPLTPEVAPPAPAAEVTKPATAANAPAAKAMAAKATADAKPKRVWTARAPREPRAVAVADVAPRAAEPAPVERVRDEPVSAPTEPASDLPAQPTRAEIVAAMSAVMPTLQSCVGASHGNVELKLTVRAQGFVSYALIGGDFAGTKEGSCLAQAVRKAKFPAFSDPVLHLTYPVRL